MTGRFAASSGPVRGTMRIETERGAGAGAVQAPRAVPVATLAKIATIAGARRRGWVIGESSSSRVGRRRCARGARRDDDPRVFLHGARERAENFEGRGGGELGLVEGCARSACPQRDEAR